MLSSEELLRKAVGTASDSGGDLSPILGDGLAPLSVEQVKQFIELMAAQQVMLGDVRTVTSNAAKWQESIIQFADRVARPGTEGTRLTTGNRVVPGTGVIELSTVLLRGEVPITDEVFEDNVAGQGLVGSIERTLSDRFGYDIEDLMVNGEIGFSEGSSDDQAYYGQLDGWLKQAKDDGEAVDGSSYGQDYQELFRVLLQSMPHRFLRTIETDGRFYIPKRTEQKYRDILAARGTALGDLMLTGRNELRYQGILVMGVPSFRVSDEDTSSILLTNKNNLYAGYHRAMKFETYRDPREGATSFIITARVDAKVAVPEATVVAYDVDISV
jgi:hypothetical protein